MQHMSFTKNETQEGGQMIEAYISLMLNKGKGVWGFWVRQASYGKVTRKSAVKRVD